VNEQRKLWTIALAGAVVIAATGFAASQLVGEGAGMPVVALGASLWTAGFVRWSMRRRWP